MVPNMQLRKHNSEGNICYFLNDISADLLYRFLSAGNNLPASSKTVLFTEKTRRQSASTTLQTFKNLWQLTNYKQRLTVRMTVSNSKLRFMSALCAKENLSPDQTGAGSQIRILTKFDGLFFIFHRRFISCSFIARSTSFIRFFYFISLLWRCFLCHIPPFNSHPPFWFFSSTSLW